MDSLDCGVDLGESILDSIDSSVDLLLDSVESKTDSTDSSESCADSIDLPLDSGESIADSTLDSTDLCKSKTSAYIFCPPQDTLTPLIISFSLRHLSLCQNPLNSIPCDNFAIIFHKNIATFFDFL